MIAWKNVEKYILPATQDFQHRFDLEGNTLNTYLLSPSGTGLLSEANNLSSYRVRLNNLDTTNRDIKVNSALYLDKLKSTFFNSGLRCRQFGEENVMVVEPLKDINITFIAITGTTDAYTVQGFEYIDRTPRYNRILNKEKALNQCKKILNGKYKYYLEM